MTTRAYLLTGRPGVGKTTCLRKVLELAQVPAGGFFTEEIRERDKRVGFALLTLDGHRTTLAHADRTGSPRVGKYGVNLAAVDGVAVPAIHAAIRARQLVVIDEIGKMEMCSPAFRQAVEEALRSPVLVLGTILAAPNPWADSIKAHPAARLIEVNLANRDALPYELARLLTAARSCGSTGLQ